MPISPGWTTIREAAERLGVTIQRVHQLIREYELETMSVNPRFKLMRERDVKRLETADRPTGVHRGRQTI